MPTEEEWRQIGCQRRLGQTGNNSMGTSYNQQGYAACQT
jgi:hypothetical protein